MDYIYDAAGKKHRSPGPYDYVNNVHYSPDGFEAVYTDEGRVTPIYNDSLGILDSFQYEWVIMDHLGNGRVYFSDLDKNLGISIAGVQEVLQERHYYPFGLMYEGPFYAQVGPENEYTYNGKRFHREGDLNWYDYGARWYAAAVARWWVQDNCAEKYYPITSYHYGANNPISTIDINGDSIIVLSAPNNVHGLGHAAVLIGNEVDGWNLYSKNGTTHKSGASGPSNVHPESGVPFENLEDFANGRSNTNEDGTQKYTEGYLIETDSKQDTKATEAAKEAVESDYNVLCNSCIDVPSSALKAAGLKDGTTTDRAYSPSSGAVITRTSKNPVPNIKYKQIKKDNKGQVIGGDRLRPSTRSPRGLRRGGIYQGKRRVPNR